MEGKQQHPFFSQQPLCMAPGGGSKEEFKEEEWNFWIDGKSLLLHGEFYVIRSIIEKPLK